MSVRLRLFYKKRGGACFVPHVALAQVFARAARRAGMALSVTEGFSPRPKMSFGPELPAGVVALCEPVDVYLEGVGEPDPESGALAKSLGSRWDARMPEGFGVVDALFPAPDSPSLGKQCREALYHVRAPALSEAALRESLSVVYGADLVLATCELLAGWLSLVLASPAQNGVGRWVRGMIETGLVEGWQDVNIVRVAVGRWNGTAIELPGSGGREWQ